MFIGLRKGVIMFAVGRGKDLFPYKPGATIAHALGNWIQVK
jgi:hypothetical protein